jgi:hypothetical protein
MKNKELFSLNEALKYTPLKSRTTLSKYINRYQGADWAINEVLIKKKYDNKGVTSIRYLVSGVWIKEFNKRYKAGKLIEYKLFSIDEVRYTLNDIIKYCKKNQITLIKDFIKNKNNDEKKRNSIIKNS